ncbi:hypothetical protein BDF19DRAFT_456807 [Syncephalis fuscata]|nr:hypothetical protein BDF19DRAFT_456807 [Syncephalis fuscata]
MRQLGGRICTDCAQKLQLAGCTARSRAAPPSFNTDLQPRASPTRTCLTSTRSSYRILAVRDHSQPSPLATSLFLNPSYASPRPTRLYDKPRPFTTLRPTPTQYFYSADKNTTEHGYSNEELPKLSPELVNYIESMLESMGANKMISYKEAINALNRKDIELLSQPDEFSALLLKINRHPSSSSLALGFRVLGRMRDQGIKFTTLRQFNQLIWFYSQHRQLSQLWRTFLRVLRICRTANIVTYNHMLNAFGETDYKLVSLILNEMNRQHIKPNTTTYNILLRLLSKHQDNFAQMLQIYQTMTNNTNEMAATQPNHYTYTTLMHAAAQAGHTELVAKFRAIMQQNNVPENTVSYTVLINATPLPPRDSISIEPWRDRPPPSQHRQLECTLVLGQDKRLFEEMQRMDIIPNQYTYTSLMDRAFKGGNQELALDYYAKMVGGGHEPDIVGYGALYYGLGLTGKIEMSEQFHREVRERFLTEGLKYKTIRAYTRSQYGHHRDAIDILKPFLKTNQLDVVAAITLLIAYARARHLSAALRAWRKMLFQNGIEFANQVHRPLLMAFARRGEIRVVQWLFSRVAHLHRYSLLPNEMIYALLRAYARRGRATEALDLWRQSLHLGIVFTPNMITQLFIACSVGRDANSLAVIEADLATVQVSLNGFHLSTWIVALARVGQIERCRDLVDHSLRHDIWLKSWVRLACKSAGVNVDDIYIAHNTSPHTKN